MAKGTVKIQGEKFESLWRDIKSRDRFAQELNVSTSSVTSWSRAGVHSVNIQKFESWPKNVQDAIRVNGDAPAEPPPPWWIGQYKTLAEAQEALARAWNDPSVKKAAKRRGG